MTIEEIYKIIKDKQLANSENSYVASLFTAGKDRIIQKVGEEATEVVIAAKNEKRKEIVAEVADLWFHSLILLAAFAISPKDILDELERRKK